MTRDRKAEPSRRLTSFCWVATSFMRIVRRGPLCTKSWARYESSPLVTALFRWSFLVTQKTGRLKATSESGVHAFCKAHTLTVLPSILNSFPAINYEDSNLNVAIPVFSIHGNHDDPQGVGAEGALSAVDLLSVTGLINYFGKVELPAADAVARKGASQAPAKGGLSDVGIRIRPVLLQKGRTKIALYGMGNIKDERMHFELRTNRVRMYRPAENPDEWFNILTLHQNRAAHDPKAVVPETMFDDSIHLVVWGHEHEQLIRPQPVAGKRYHISQPGSSVATSLCPGEAAEKQVAIIHVKERDFHLEQIPLKTVRPFVMEDIDLDQAVEEARLQIDDKQGVTKLLKSKVKELVERANHEQLQKCASTSEDQRPDQMLPLVRLRVYYTRHEMGNLVRFGQDLVGKVANPRDLLQFSKKKGGAFDRKNANLSKTYLEPTDEMLSAEKLEKVRMSDLVQTYLATQSLHILDPHGLERSVMQFVDKDDRDAISQFVKKELRLTNAGLVTADPDERALEAELDRIREQKNRVVDEATTKGIDTEHSDAAHERGATQARSARRHGSLDDSMDSDDSMMDDIFGDKDVPAPTQRAQAKNRGRTTTNRSGRQVVSGTATPSSSRRYGGTQAMLTFRGDSEDEEDQTRTSRPRPTLSSRAAALAAPAKKGNARNKPTPTPTPTSKRAAALASTSKATTSRTTGTRAAARKASSRFVETQAPGDGDEEEAEAFVVDDEDDDFED